MDVLTLWAIFTLPAVANNLQVIVFLAVALFGVGLVGYAACLSDDGEDVAKVIPVWKVSKPWLIAASILWGVLLFVPSEKAMKYIIGGYLVTNIEHIDELPPNLVKAANRFLEEYTEETPTEK